MSKRYDLNIQGHKLIALAYNEDKTGMPIISIHGITGSVNFWDGIQTPLIMEQFPWYSLSLPAHYPAEFSTDFQRSDLTAKLIADLLSQAISELVGEQKVLLIGHSTGGFACLSIAVHSPELVAGIISVSGFARGKWTGGLGAMQHLVRLGGQLGEQAFIAWYSLNQKLPWVNRPIWRIYSVNHRQMYESLESTFEIQHANFSQLNLQHMVDYFARMPDIDILPRLSAIDVPTLALAGDKDPIVPPFQAKLIAEAIPNAELQYLSKTGHLPMLESPSAYHENISTWIQEHFI